MTQTIDRTATPTCTCPTCGQGVAPSNDRARAAYLCRGRHVTPRQMDALEFVLRFRRTVGFSPTMDQIGEELGVSKVSAFEHVHALAKAGVLRMDKHKARSIEPVE